MSNEEQHTGRSGGKATFGDFASSMVYYTDEVFYDEVSERAGL